MSSVLEKAAAAVAKSKAAAKEAYRKLVAAVAKNDSDHDANSVFATLEASGRMVEYLRQDVNRWQHCL